MSHSDRQRGLKWNLSWTDFDLFAEEVPHTEGEVKEKIQLP